MTSGIRLKGLKLQELKASGFLGSGIGFVLPGLLGFFVFFILPFCLSLVYAFMDKPIGGSFIGFANFTSLFKNRAYLRGLVNTIRFIGISTPLNIAISLGLAMLVNRIIKNREWFSLIFLIPLVIPSGSMVFFWKALFSYDGALNGMLRNFGIAKINWLDSGLALPVMILIFLWKNCGYNMVLFLSGLGTIPKDYYEAAWMDNASSFAIFRHITVPCLLPTAVLTLIMSIINSFKIFREIFLITGSYPQENIYTLQHFMNNMFASLNYPRLTSATAVLVIIIVLFTRLLLHRERKAAL
jgi:multiple sugar transport system permease protein